MASRDTLLDEEDQRLAFAIHEHLPDALDVAGRFSLLHQAVLRAPEQVHRPGLQALLERRLIEIAECEHLAALLILDGGRDETLVVEDQSLHQRPEGGFGILDFGFWIDVLHRRTVTPRARSARFTSLTESSPK